MSTTTLKVVPPWEPAPLGFTCGEDSRSPENLIRALAQFAVQCCHRYDQGFPNPGDTHCNCFVWDSTCALGCEIPHWVNEGGHRVEVGQGRELSANGQIGWLRAYGSDNGWMRAERPAALSWAENGRPCVVTWDNPQVMPDGRRAASHVAMLLPPIGDECRIAAAGRLNLWDVPIEASFGPFTPRCEFWAHN